MMFEFADCINSGLPGSFSYYHGHSSYFFAQVLVLVFEELMSSVVVHSASAACTHLPRCGVEEGLMSRQTLYRSYRGLFFTGQMTQPTASKH